VTFGDIPLFRGEDMEAMCRLLEEQKASCVLMTSENSELVKRDIWGCATQPLMQEAIESR